MSGIEDYYLEPISLAIKSSGEERRGTNLVRNSSEATPSAIGPEYFFRKGIVQNEKFDEIDLRKLIINSFQDSMKEIEKSIEERLIDSFPTKELLETSFFAEEGRINRAGRLIASSTPQAFYKYNSVNVLVYPISPTDFLVFGKEKDKVSEVREFIENKLESLNDITSDFGLELNDFLKGKKYQKHNLMDSAEIEDVRIEEPKNEFENEIIENCKIFSNSFLSNVEVIISESSENFEYDIYSGIEDIFQVIIEPTDYEKVKEKIESQEITSENFKSEIILKTNYKVEQLPQTDVKKVIVIAKGFPNDVFKNLKEIAEASNIHLLNGEDYREKMLNIIWKGIFESFEASHRKLPASHRRF